MLGPNNLIPNSFLSDQIFNKKNCWVKKMLGEENIESKNISGKKCFAKQCWVQNFAESQQIKLWVWRGGCPRQEGGCTGREGINGLNKCRRLAKDFKMDQVWQ